MGLCDRRGDERVFRSADVEGDAEAAAQAEASLQRCDPFVVDAVSDAAPAARILDHRRAGLRLVQLLLDDPGVSSVQPLWSWRRSCGDLWRGGCGGCADRSAGRQ